MTENQHDDVPLEIDVSGGKGGMLFLAATVVLITMLSLASLNFKPAGPGDVAREAVGILSAPLRSMPSGAVCSHLRDEPFELLACAEVVGMQKGAFRRQRTYAIAFFVPFLAMILIPVIIRLKRSKAPAAG